MPWRRVKTASVGVVLLVTACSPAQPSSAARSSGSDGVSQSVAAKGAGTTSCASVRFIGDSLTVGMVSSLQIPRENERLAARLAAVGVKHLSIDASGGRSAAERVSARPNALDVMPASSTFDGCYIIAIGTNDAADINAGSLHSARERIANVMARAHGRPVLWPTVIVTERGAGAYTPAATAAFDAELKAQAKRYPNLRIYDWAAERDASWTGPDGVHDLRIGSRSRALMDARALAVAFPAHGGPSAAVVVGSVAGRAASRANAVHLTPEPGDDASFWGGEKAALNHYTDGPPMT